MDKNENRNNSKQILLSIIGVAILIVAVVGISFAAFTYSKAGNVENTISTGTISMSYNESTNGILIENAVPLSETDGKALIGEREYFDFTVSADIVGNTTINYEVVAVKDNASFTNVVSDSDIRLYLEQSADNGTTYTQKMAPSAWTSIDPSNESGTDSYGASNGSMKLTEGTFAGTAGTNASATHYYRLKMWVDQAYVVDGTARSYQVKVNVYGKGTN